MRVALAILILGVVFALLFMAGAIRLASIADDNDDLAERQVRGGPPVPSHGEGFN